MKKTLTEIQNDRMNRRAFAIAWAGKIRAELESTEKKLWRVAAKQAKDAGLYSRSTYDGDIATGLTHYAGLRYRSMITRGREGSEG